MRMRPQSQKSHYSGKLAHEGKKKERENWKDQKKKNPKEPEMNETHKFSVVYIVLENSKSLNSSRFLRFQIKNKSIRPSNLINSEKIGDQQVGHLTSYHMYNK